MFDFAAVGETVRHASPVLFQLLVTTTKLKLVFVAHVHWWHETTLNMIFQVYKLLWITAEATMLIDLASIFLISVQGVTCPVFFFCFGVSYLFYCNRCGWFAQAAVSGGSFRVDRGLEHPYLRLSVTGLYHWHTPRPRGWWQQWVIPLSFGRYLRGLGAAKSETHG